MVKKSSLSSTLKLNLFFFPLFVSTDSYPLKGNYILAILLIRESKYEEDWYFSKEPITHGSRAHTLAGGEMSRSSHLTSYCPLKFQPVLLSVLMAAAHKPLCRMELPGTLTTSHIFFFLIKEGRTCKGCQAHAMPS